MAKPKLLDLFCCAGGAGAGYHRSGFDVYGVDLVPQANYPFPFHRADCLDVLRDLIAGRPVSFVSGGGGHVERLYLSDFDAIHGSPPCQAYTPLGALHPHITYPDLVAVTRSHLEQIGKPYVIENVMAAPLLKDRSIILCGGMFDLRTYRHRRFESNIGLVPPEHPKHVIRTATKQRRARWADGWHVSITGDVGVYLGPEAMGIDWMTGNELCQAIPPAYTRHIGAMLLDHLSNGSDEC